MPRKPTKSKAASAPALSMSDAERKMLAAVGRILPNPPEAADAVALSLLAVKVAEWVDLRDKLQAVGIAEYGERQGSSHLTPEARREAEVFGQILALCKEFGLTPASRGRLAAKVAAAVKDEKPEPILGFISADPGKPMKD